MGKALRTLVLLAAFVASAFAADTDYGPLTVTGIVTYKRTGETIKGVTVAIAGTDISARTDASGRFLITSAPAGRQTLVASYMGFSDARVPIRVGTRKATYANIAMAAAMSLDCPGPYMVASPRPLRERYLSLRTGHLAIGLPSDLILLDVDARWQRVRVGASVGGFRYPPQFTGPTFRAGCTVYERPLRYMESWPWGPRNWLHKGVYGFLPEVYAQVEVCPWTWREDGLGIRGLAVATANCAVEYLYLRAGVYAGCMVGHEPIHETGSQPGDWSLWPAYGVSFTIGSFTTGF